MTTESPTTSACTCCVETVGCCATPGASDAAPAAAACRDPACCPTAPQVAPAPAADACGTAAGGACCGAAALGCCADKPLTSFP
jgi:hypothetical protein